MIEEFTCRSCHFVQNYDDAPVRCPKCNMAYYRLRFIKNLRSKATFVNMGYKDSPRYSVTLGVSETQIEAAKCLHPQAEWKKFGHSYRPLIKNRAEKKKMMKQADYEEYDPKDFKGKD